MSGNSCDKSPEGASTATVRMLVGCMPNRVVSEKAMPTKLQIHLMRQLFITLRSRVGLLWVTFQRFTNREQENGTLAFCAR